MKKIEILVVCCHQQILETIIRLVNNNPEWHGTGAISGTAARDLFQNNAYELVLLGSGLEDAEETSLRATFLAINPSVGIITHYGGGSGLLKAEILGALAAQ